MKRLTIIFLLLSAWLSPAASFRVECDFFVTTNNGPITGATFTLNSQTRTWTNNTLASTNFVITTNGYGWAATNLWANLTDNPLTNVVQVDKLGTNAIRIYGAVDYYLSVAPSAGWSTNILRTNYVFTSAAVIQPFPTNFTESFKTNQMSALASNLDQYATYPLKTNSAALSNYVTKGASLTQTVTAPLVLNQLAGGTNTGIVYGGVFSNATVRAPTIQGGSATGIVLTNSTLAGSFFEISGIYPFAHFTGEQSTLDDDGGMVDYRRSSILVGNRTNVESGMYIGQLRFLGYGDTGYQKAARIVVSADERFTDSTSAGALRFRLTPSGSVGDVDRVRITHAQSSFSNAVWVTGAQTNVGPVIATNVILQNGTWTNGAAALSGATITNLVVTAGGTASNLNLATPKATNAAFYLKTTIAGAVLRPRLSISSLANGGNSALPILTNSRVLLLPGTLSATASIDGIDSTGITDGFQLDVLSLCGQNVSFGAESGIEAVPANRIIVLNATTNMTTDGWAQLEYLSLSNRWVLKILSP